MKKVIRLTEKDLTRIVKRVMNESNNIMEKSFLDKFRKKNVLDPEHNDMADTIEDLYLNTHIDRSKSAHEIEKGGDVYVRFLEKNGDEMFYNPKNNEVYNSIED